MGKFPYKKYIFYWEDPLGNSSWCSANDMEKLKPALINTEAYLYSRNKRHVKTFASYIKEDDGTYTYGDVNVFLASGLVKMTRI